MRAFFVELEGCLYERSVYQCAPFRSRRLLLREPK